MTNSTQLDSPLYAIVWNDPQQRSGVYLRFACGREHFINSFASFSETYEAALTYSRLRQSARDMGCRL